MTLWEKVADIISGGALEKRDAKIQDLQRMCGSSRLHAYDESERARATEREYFRLLGALLDIIERGNTDRPNSTVKAMQKIAREAVEK